MRITAVPFIFIFYLLHSSVVYSQDSIQKVSTKYLESVNKRSSSLELKLGDKSSKALRRFVKQEAKLKNKLAKIDSFAAHSVFANTAEKYEQLNQKLKDSKALSQYIPFLDTLKTSFKFIEQNQQLLSNVKEGKGKLDNALSKMKELESKLQKAEDIKQFLKERRQYLKDQLSQFGFAKEFKKINKEVFYYSEQIKQYKEILNDPNKIERKAIELLSKTKFFQDFMKKNSMLALLFRMPGDPNDPSYQASLAGLQTRAQVNALIQNQISIGGPGAQQQIQNNIQQAQSQLQELKNEVNQWGGGSSDDIMPEGFKPNNQKTKSFLQRLEFGTNVQSQRATSYFPVTSDIGLSLGYRLSEKGIIGIGTSYKMGWGTGWNNLRITHQGIGLRSFVDVKLKGSFWISGGYEQNFKSEINSIDQLRNQSAWQQSGLIGMSKTVSVKSKLFKKTKVQLLWDFLSYQQIPKAQPIVFRVGYNIK